MQINSENANPAYDAVRRLQLPREFIRRVVLSQENPGRWRRIKLIDHAPTFPGCYALIHDGRVVYLGQSTSLVRRLKGHGWKVERGGVMTEWGFVPGGILKIRVSRRRAEHLMVEARMIERLRPRFNRQIPEYGRRRGPEVAFEVAPLPDCDHKKADLMSLRELSDHLGLGYEKTAHLYRDEIIQVVPRDRVEAVLDRLKVTARKAENARNA